jgi:hypothetical protein
MGSMEKLASRVSQQKLAPEVPEVCPVVLVSVVPLEVQAFLVFLVQLVAVAS